MSAIPRIRMLAGPNGSGKSTLTNDLRALVPLGRELNPDSVEKQIILQGHLDLTSLGLTAAQAELHDFFANHPLSNRGSSTTLTVVGNVVSAPEKSDLGYAIAILSDFIRRKWLESRESFTFETVMSHPGKIDILTEARSIGYRTYLYFVCTDSPLINIGRVEQRVLAGGHDVQTARIVARYTRTLELLPAAIAASDRAYIFDNSGAGVPHRLIAEYESNKLTALADLIPSWFAKAMAAKS